LIGTPIQPIDLNFFPKTSIFSLNSVKQPKIGIRATHWNLQAGLKILKKVIGTPNQPVKTKNFSPILPKFLQNAKFFNFNVLDNIRKIIVVLNLSLWMVKRGGLGHVIHISKQITPLL
jgi:hypothetical protein